MQTLHADTDAKFWRGQVVRLTLTIPGMAIPTGSTGSVQDSFVSLRGNLFNYTYQVLFDDGRTHRGVPETYLEAMYQPTGNGSNDSNQGSNVNRSTE